MINFTSVPNMSLDFEIAALEGGKFLVEIPSEKFQETFEPDQANTFLAMIVHSVARHFEIRNDPKSGQSFVVLRSDDDLRNGGRFSGLFTPDNRREWH